MKENILYSKGEPLKERKLTVELTDETLIDFVELCFRDGTTPAEVLGGFINDLVCGNHSRGSDERDLANAYYDRCGYGYFYQARDFLQWALAYDAVGTIADYLKDIAEIEEEIAFLTENPGKGEEEDIERNRGYIAANMNDIEDLFRQFCKEEKIEPKFEEELEKIKNYIALKDNLKKGGTI